MAKPRFQRTKPRPFQVTERDIEIMRLVYEHRCLRSDQIFVLIEGSRTALGHRLRLLYDAGLLDRPRNQGVYRSEAVHYTYAIGDKGEAVLAERFGIETRSRSWTDKNRELQARHLAHTLGVSDLMVALRTELKAHPGIHLITREELLRGTPEERRRRQNPYSWRISILRQGQREDIGLNPDQMFGLSFLELPEGARRAFFFVEIDRATMPIVRGGKRQTSFLEKMIAYSQTRAAWRADPGRAPFGFSKFRVLTVTTSPERAANMRQAYQEHAGERDLDAFLFLDRQTLRQGSVLDPIWTNGRGMSASLLPTPNQTLRSRPSPPSYRVSVS